MIRKTGMFFLLLGALSGCDSTKDLPLLGRYVAKNVCASIWVEGYEPAAAMAYVTNVAPMIQPSWRVTVGEGSVRAQNYWFPWVMPKNATLVQADAAAMGDCRNDYGVSGAASSLSLTAPPSPLQDALNPESALQGYLNTVVSVGAPEFTTAILVLKGDQVVAEAYRDGLGPQSPLKGFSMSKSFANLLVGRQVDKQAVAVTDALLLPGWALDQRAAISWDHSLRMSSGLDWHEASLGAMNDQGQLFYNTADPAAYAYNKPYAAEPNTRFNYSSGDSMNISSALVMLEDWFDPGWDLDGPHALGLSPDGQTPLLGEGVYLTTRGWAALASVYMHGGRLGDQQIVSPGWVAYSLTPSETNHDYGAGIWLNLGQNLFPDLPPDTFAFAGSYDRYVVAVPSHDVVVVRIGFSAQPGDFDMQRFVLNVLDLVPY